MKCQVCSHPMMAHRNRLSHILLSGPDVPPITMKLSAKGADQDSGLKLTGKAGCRKCLTSEKILGYFLPQIAQTTGQKWTEATVFWKDGKQFAVVPREALDLPKPVEQREVAVIGGLRVLAVDERGSGGANHDYLVLMAKTVKTEDGEVKPLPPAVVGGAQFQRGPVGAEDSRDGITNEAVLAMVKDRLEGFQAGPFACDENGMALFHIDQALAQLAARTADRVARGVEGMVAP